MKKRLLANVLALACIVSSFTFSVFAEGGTAPDKIEAESCLTMYDATETDLQDTAFPQAATRDGLKIENGGTGQQIGGTGHKNWLLFGDIDFGTGHNGFIANYSARGSRCSSTARIEVRLDDPDAEAVCVVNTPATSDSGWSVYETVSVEFDTPITGVHDLYIYMLGEPESSDKTCIGNFDYFGFTKTEVQTLTLNKTTLDLAPLQLETLTATIAPANAVDKSVIWLSSAPDVATVQNGIVTALKAGTTKITVLTANNITAECTVTVTNPTIPVTSVKITSGNKTLLAGKSVSLAATVSPKNATNGGVTWKSSDVKLATVNQNGVVKAIKAGTVTITAVSKDNAKLASSVKITIKPVKVVITKASGKKGSATIKFKKASGANKYSVVIKTSKGKKIVSTSTNKLNVTLKSKKLVKGKYVACVSYTVNKISSDVTNKSFTIKK